jgi:hypothetical protein
MTTKLLIEMVVLGVVIMAEWDGLRTCKPMTKILFFLLVGVSGILWFYVFTAKHIIHPASYFGGFFKHLDPFV